ncbi:MAG TPA: DNA primase [Elusimicrobiales bacterium]|nr:DNA primase [Elusimicrobiales bacterium]
MTSHPLSDSVRAKLDIVDVVRDYIPSLRKAGRNYKAACPFHDEKTPSFTVSQDKQIYYCFGCNEGGDMFKFVMKIDGLTFVEALKKLSLKAGIPWKETEYSQLSARERERLDMKKVLAAAADFYSRLLFASNGEQARLYLGRRKINKASVERFGLGFAPGEPSLTAELERKGFSKELIVSAGLAAVRDNGQVTDYFRDRIVFPIRNAAGEVIAFGGRAGEGGQPKYLNSPETPLFSKRRTLYGIHEALPQVRKEGRILILEGYMDVIAAHQHGVAFAVAPLGTALSSDHAEFIKRYSKDAILMFDADDAGVNASVRASDIFMDAGMYVRVADLGGGMDPDEFLNEHGREAFDAKLAAAADPLEFRTSVMLRGTTGEPTAQEKARMISSLLDTVVRQGDEILKSEWVKALSERFSVTEESVSRQLKKKKAAPQPVRQGQAPAAPTPAPDIPPMELGFLHLLLKDPSLADCARELTEHDFQSQASRSIFSAIRDMAGGDQATIAARLTEKLPEYSGIVLQLSVRDLDPETNTVQNAAKTAGEIKRFSLERRRKALHQKLHAGSITPDELREYRDLAGRLKAAPRGGTQE